MAKLMFRYLHKSSLSKQVSNVRNQITKTAGIIVIGDEILKGEVTDTNSSYMTKRLHDLGVKVKKITVIGDVLDEISKEVSDFSKRYNYVITTGGIGPTHDDITFEAVANAFSEHIVLNPELVKICAEFYKTSDVNSPGMKLARVPESAKLYFLDDPKTGIKVNYPNICVRNVYMFPGIPQLFEKSFDIVASKLFQSQSKFYTKKIYINTTEDRVVQALDTVVKEFPNVLIGSYPKLFSSDYKVKITLESTEESAVNEACNKLLKTVPESFVVRVD